MKKLMMICAFVFSVITYANAQKGATPEEKVKKMVDRLTEKVMLTADQQAKLTSMYMEQNVAMAKIKEETGDDKTAWKEKSSMLRKENEGKLKAMLTDDQKTAYKAMQDEQREKMKNAKAKAAPEKPADNM